MSEKEKYSLMIWCGALWDIAEKSNEPYTQKQVNEVRYNIEKLCGEKDIAQSTIQKLKSNT